MKIPLLAIDPAFATTGVVTAEFDLATQGLAVRAIDFLKTEKSSNKSIRRNSDDLRRAREIRDFLKPYIKKSAIVLAEIPTGSQSAKASKGLGIALGLLASIEKPLIEVYAKAVKKHFTGISTASKSRMIETAVKKYDWLPWLRYNGKLKNDNEHIADAIAVLEYGITTQQFQDLVSALESLRAA